MHLVDYGSPKTKGGAKLERTAHNYGLDVLIEVHNKYDLRKAMQLKSKLIGINNRNLRTLKTDLTITKKIAPLVPKSRIIISESGINNEKDIAKALQYKVSGFLIGEALMKSKDIQNKTKRLSNIGTILKR